MGVSLWQCSGAESCPADRRSRASDRKAGQGGPNGSRPQITVERRLYDIGSILATLNLIQRTYVEGKRCVAAVH